MAYHFIAISSYYREGKRIGWHYASNDKLSKEVISVFLSESKEKLGEIDFSIHKLITESTEWRSVVEKDSFFADVVIIEDKEKFLDLLIDDKKISALDIAKFFLSVGPVTNLKLQKLIYFAYEIYLLKTGKRLFEEPIVAFQHGPVVEEVYHSYKQHGREKISRDDDEVALQLKDVTMPIAWAKIALSDQSKEISSALKETWERYWKESAWQLVDISHSPGGPWYQVYEESLNNKITDEVIIKYHDNEITPA